MRWVARARRSARKTFGVAAEEHDFARAAVAQIAEPASELLRRELIAGGVEQDERGARLDLQLAQRGGRGFAQFGDLDFGVAADARDVVVQQRADFFAARFSQHDQADFHEGRMPARGPFISRPYFLRFSSSVLRLMPRIGGAADFVVRGFERGLDGFAFDVFERTQRADGAARCARRAVRAPENPRS